MSYIAMGDSFTSGEGETSDAFYLSGTNDPMEKCHLSLRSYPYLLQQEIGLPLDIHSVACSGAETIDVAGPGIYNGQSDRLTSGGLGLDVQGVRERQLWALQNFIPGETQQANFVGRYHPDIISLGIGGNDIGMIEKLKSCMMPDTCEWANGDSRRQAGREIKSLFSKLVVTYDAVRASDPNGVLYVVGYPKIINDNGFCDVLTGSLFNYSERQFMNQAIDYLDTVIEQAADFTGAVYVQEENAFAGQLLCDTTATPAMNGIRAGDDIAPVGSVDWLTLVGDETFHPTPYGHVLLSSALRQAVLDHFGQPPPLAQLGASAPREPEYWDDDGRTLPVLENAKLLGPRQDSDSKLDFSLPAGSFQPGGSVEVTTHSDVLLLATIPVNEQGGVSGEVTLPNSLENGFHTIVVEGKDLDGQAIDYYQGFSYTGGRPLELPVLYSKTDRPNPHVVDAVSGLSVSNAPPNPPGDTAQTNPSAVLGERAERPSPKDTSSGVPTWIMLGVCGLGLLGCSLFIFLYYRRRRMTR